MSPRQKQTDQLSELVATRQGLTRSNQYRKQELGHGGRIYNELDNHQDKVVVKDRLQQDNFIEDDDGGGYADHGMDDLERGEGCQDKRSIGTKIMCADGKLKSNPNPEVEPIPDVSAGRRVINEERESDSLASPLRSLNAIPASATCSRPLKRKYGGADMTGKNFHTHRPLPRVIASSSGPLDHYSDVPSLSSCVRSYNGVHPSSDSVGDQWGVDIHNEPENDSHPAKKPRFETGAVASRRNDITIPDDDSLYDSYSADDMHMNDKPAVVKTEEQESHRPPLKPVDNLPRPQENKGAGFPSWLSVHATQNVKSDDTLNPSFVKLSVVSNVSALEVDGSLQFFWLDYLENDGRVYLFGKVMDKPTGKWVSCCVAVENIERNLYVLKRERRVEDGKETDEIPTNAEVLQDCEKVRRKAGINKWSAKFVNRRYPFGEPGVPTEEVEWMKVVYDFAAPPLPIDISTPSFSRVFGTNTSAFELLILKRKIMRPCWLQVKQPAISQTGVSWCMLDVVVSNPKDVNPFPETNATAPREIPPLTMMSVSLRTVVDHKESKREIVCAGTDQAR